MRVAFRVDASPEMGSGHLMRCLTLADELAGRGAAVQFLTRASAGPLLDLVRAKGHVVVVLADDDGGSGVRPMGLTPSNADTDYAHWLPVSQLRDAEQTTSALRSQTHGSDPLDWLVVDHYALDHRWERAMRPHAKRLMVIDDLADRPHDCDLLLDQNLVAGLETRYDGLVPETCRTLLGPMYALLRPDFAKARKALRPRDGTVRRILVAFGGSDPTNETSKALDAIAALNRPDIAVEVVVGAACPHVEAIRARTAALPNAGLHVQAANMAELMASTDLAIGAGGSMTWERCCLGLPAIAVAVAKNQRPTLDCLGRLMAVLDLGAADKVTSADLGAGISVVLLSPTAAIALSRASRPLTDGHGMSRVIASLGLSCNRIRMRPARLEDMQRLLDWRNHPSARNASITIHEISPSEHRAWFERVLADPMHAALIAETDDVAIGVVRYVVSGHQARVSITVAPAQQGRGLGEKMLRAGEAWLALHHPTVRTIRAEILPHNVASLRIFGAAGFTAEKLCYLRDVAP